MRRKQFSRVPEETILKSTRRKQLQEYQKKQFQEYQKKTVSRVPEENSFDSTRRKQFQEYEKKTLNFKSTRVMSIYCSHKEHVLHDLQIVHAVKVYALTHQQQYHEHYSGCITSIKHSNCFLFKLLHNLISEKYK